jgi:hypothetical protein
LQSRFLNSSPLGLFGTVRGRAQYTRGNGPVIFEVSSFWDGGFDVRLGDAMNGFLEQDTVKTWSQVEEWLRTAALRHYPDSAFAKHTP